MKKGGAERARQAPSTPTLVQIVKPIYGGSFLARAEGKAVFVPLALPGEQVHARIVEEKRSYATAEVEQIVAAAPQRVAPKCRHFGVCGGCQYQHAEYAAQLDWKKTILRETLERSGVRIPAEIDVIAANPWEYRNRIRLAFDARGDLGYRGRRSHEVVPIAECPIAAPALTKAASTAAEFFQQFAVASRPTELSLFCNSSEDSLLASIFTAGTAPVPLVDYYEALRQKIPSLRGVELVETHESKPSRTVTRAGATSLAYRAAGFDYRVDHGAFFQVNRWLADALVERVVGSQSGKLAWDLFAGVGLFAKQLAEKFGGVTAIESAPTAVEALKQNLSETNARAVKATTLEFLRGARNDLRRDFIVPDFIVVDPPRAGLCTETTALLAKISAPSLTYVSCDPATLARDLRVLVGAGYAIRDIALADLFPQTFHLETVVRMRR
jgi:23S rRNA (uracil1939-C5)-methyltransferase